MSANPLLGPNEQEPVMLERPEGAGAIVLVCEHASKTLPRVLGNLGLDDEALSSHIGWDIGALGVARHLSAALDATLIAQAYSRLAYDCNRPPEAPGSIPEKSEIFEVPGNAGLSEAERQARISALYDPFHAAISKVLDERRDKGRRTILVTVHSFTPIYFGAPRDGRLGLLHDARAGLAETMLGLAKEQGIDDVRLNYPYGVADGVTHTLQRHGVARGIDNVMLEIRNDLIAGPEGQAEWGDRISRLLGAAIGVKPEGAKSC